MRFGFCANVTIFGCLHGARRRQVTFPSSFQAFALIGCISRHFVLAQYYFCVCCHMMTAVTTVLFPQLKSPLFSGR